MRRRRLHRRERKLRNKKIIITSICLICLMSVGFAAFQTNLSLKATGNVKDLQKEVDNKVPTNELLFWGQANNSENTLTALKDKSGNNNDGTLYNFDNTNSGFINDELVFDGVDDYVDLGFANYDFDNGMSAIVYVKPLSIITSNLQTIIDNQEGAGFHLSLYINQFTSAIHNGTTYINLLSNYTYVLETYYTVTITYDNTNLKIYVNGNLANTTAVEKLTTSAVDIALGTNLNTDGSGSQYANMSLKEVMLYDRALTDDEVKTITEGFQRKYG